MLRLPSPQHSSGQGPSSAPRPPAPSKQPSDTCWVSGPGWTLVTQRSLPSVQTLVLSLHLGAAPCARARVLPVHTVQSGTAALCGCFVPGDQGAEVTLWGAPDTRQEAAMSTGVERGRRGSRWQELSCLQTHPPMGSKLGGNRGGREATSVRRGRGQLLLGRERGTVPVPHVTTEWGATASKSW